MNLKRKKNDLEKALDHQDKYFDDKDDFDIDMFEDPNVSGDECIRAMLEHIGIEYHDVTYDDYEGED